VLVGLEVSGVNRAADMLTLQFGPIVSWVSPRGSAKLVGTWALHIQCPWRIESAGVFLAGKSDLYEPGSESNESITLMGEKISVLFERASGIAVDATLLSRNPIVVQRVRADEFGGVWITLSEGFCLVIFPDGTRCEARRFFSSASNEAHLVVEGGALVG
jgi:hypothetical protein